MPGPSANLTNMGDNSKMGVRLVFCVHDMPTQCPLQLDEVS